MSNKRVSNSILNYLKKSRTEERVEDENTDVLPTDVAVASTSTQNQNTDLDLMETEQLKYDVGAFLAKMDTIPDITKYNLLKNHWVPEPQYEFPFSIHTKRGREERRRPTNAHFKKFEWLVFSEEKKGLFCRYCAVFSYEQLVGASQSSIPQKLVRFPLTNFAKLMGKEGDLIRHENAKYHTESTLKGKKNSIENFTPVILSQLHTVISPVAHGSLQIFQKFFFLLPN